MWGTPKRGLDFRPMTSRDIRGALAVIGAHSAEDASAAKVSYRRSIEGQFVQTAAGRVVGVTGARAIDTTDRAYWLSWTYLDEVYRGQGIGRKMIESVFDALREVEARKIFVATSNLVTGPGAGVYEKAIETYQSMGFTEEARHSNFYARGEAMIVMGLRLEPHDEEPWEPDPRSIEPIGADEMEETDDAYVMHWQFVDGPGASRGDFRRQIDRVRNWRGRIVFASVGADATTAVGQLEDAGFSRDGHLLDFYEDGIDELRFRFDLM